MAYNEYVCVLNTSYRVFSMIYLLILFFLGIIGGPSAGWLTKKVKLQKYEST